MGLCKCPKKKVTTLFCFEHRVNVCEHCLVANHANCIVQSYLQWLQDSDYDPTCKLCSKKLTDESSGDCVRLMCYDVFHWSCLNAYADQLPQNTAPAGFTCPLCKAGIFPSANVVSPVADVLRQTLSKVNWARAGLGLPLIAEEKPAVASNQLQHIPVTHGATPEAQYSSGQNVIASEATPYARSTDKAVEYFHDTRRLYDSTKGDTSQVQMPQDHDDDKYKRRPALQWFARWFKSRTKTQRRDPNAGMKRLAILIILVVIGLLTAAVIFTRIGRATAENDPFLDPLANPNIHVEDSKVV